MKKVEKLFDKNYISVLTLFLLTSSCFLPQNYSYSKVTTDGFNVVVGSELKQKMSFGVDALRLWYWRSTLKDELAQLAVGDMKPEFIRVPINCAYEREMGVKKDTAYDVIIEMMTAMRKVNPTIKLFASPEVLGQAYSSAEQLALFGATDGCPWAPYPGWIMGYTGYGGIFGGGGFNKDKAMQYLADYLNLMYSKGFVIDYMDLTQENQIITPAINKYIFDNLPSKLNVGVKMPILVVPSSWDCNTATVWLNSVNTTNGQLDAFGIAATHNTGSPGTPLGFATAATSLGKPAWNSELHGWVGDETELSDEIMTSSSLWDYVKSGFSGLETWLFFGPYGGKGHSMIWANSSSIQKSAKYEIFKKVVNSANGGNYIPTTMPSTDSVTSTFFVKDGVYSGSVLNKRKSSLGNVKFEFPASIINKNIEITKWNSTLPRAGQTTYIKVTEDKSFYSIIDAQTLYFFRISDDTIPTIITGDQINIHFENEDAVQVSIVGSAANQNPTPIIVANPYKNGLNLTDSCLYVRSRKDLTSTPAIPAWSQNSVIFTFEEPLVIADNNRFLHILHWKGQILNNWLMYATQDGTTWKEIKRDVCPAAQTWFDIVGDIKPVFSSIKAFKIYLDGNWIGSGNDRYYEPTDFYYDEISFMDTATPRSASTAVTNIVMGNTYLYPNPTKYYLYYKSEFPLTLLSVKNINGIQLMSKNGMSILDGKIYVGDLAKGFYLLELTDLNNKKSTLKFVKQ